MTAPIGRPRRHNITGAQLCDLLLLNPLNGDLETGDVTGGIRNDEFRAAIAAFTGESLPTQGEFLALMELARVTAREAGMDIPVPRKGLNYVWFLTEDENELRRSQLNHGRNSRTHQQSAIKFVDSIIAQHPAGSIAEIAAQRVRANMVEALAGLEALIQFEVDMAEQELFYA